MAPFRRSTVIGCMASSDMRHPARDTGPAGTEQQQSSCASVVCYTTRMPIAVTGPRTLMVVKSIVRILNCCFAADIIVTYLVLSALCNEDANGNVPLGKSCNRYWQCQGGYPRLQRCPAMLVFDRRSLRCVVPPTEDCDVPTTSTPILEIGDSVQGNVN